MGRLVQEKVVTSVSGVFAIMMDETTDVSGKEHATICIRHFSGGQLREDFLGFVHAKARLLLSTVKSVGLNMGNCRGLCFDGISAMMGKSRRCAAVVVREYPLAKTIHCFSHRLNLVLTKACDTKELKLALQTPSEVYNYIYSSNMRSMRFTELVKDHTSTKRKKLVSLCAIRWIERHDTVIVRSMLTCVGGSAAANNADSFTISGYCFIAS
ncbi:zinc finger MYM-type protein 1-like [Oratosquilla oratoria]|uniref:zinc finger MYM-type protein 1-like n=1 Tax=Oratosquilla oratoria TaxID=337810 RepID=UPI003F77685E